MATDIIARAIGKSALDKSNSNETAWNEIATQMSSNANEILRLGSKYSELNMQFEEFFSMITDEDEIWEVTE